jgi:hypothetical protein
MTSSNTPYLSNFGLQWASPLSSLSASGSPPWLLFPAAFAIDPLLVSSAPVRTDLVPCSGQGGVAGFIKAPFPRISKPIRTPVRDLSDPEIDFYWNDPAHPNPENLDGTVSGWINRISGVGRFI